jgi:hypothetical protein
MRVLCLDESVELLSTCRHFEVQNEVARLYFFVPLCGIDRRCLVVVFAAVFEVISSFAMPEHFSRYCSHMKIFQNFSMSWHS